MGRKPAALDPQRRRACAPRNRLPTHFGLSFPAEWRSSSAADHAETGPRGLPCSAAVLAPSGRSTLDMLENSRAVWT